MNDKTDLPCKYIVYGYDGDDEIIDEHNDEESALRELENYSRTHCDCFWGLYELKSYAKSEMKTQITRATND